MLTKEELEVEQHCAYILKDPSIGNNIVVLCEGRRAKNNERRSPQTYKRMEDLPDANFYRACIPPSWNQKPPRFFNCGNRHDTLSSYFKLLEMHKSNPSYYKALSPDLLFVLVDVDFQSARFDDKKYTVTDTESIFHDLYQDLKLQPEKLSQHQIWVTGFKHKEAYFLNPDLQPIFDEYERELQKQNRYSQLQVTRLNSIYQDMIRDLPTDPDLKEYFARAMKRICHCDLLNTEEIETLAESWQELGKGEEAIDSELIFALLAIVKSKPYWNKVMKELPNDRKDPLSLEIAKRFYARQNSDRCPSYHLPCFFRYLYDFWHDRRAIDR